MIPKKATIITAVCSLLAAALIFALHNGPDALVRIIDGLSIAGIINICAAFFCHIKNSGQFKRLSKTSLTISQEEKEKKEDKKEEKKWNPLPFYICGVPLLLVSVIMIYTVA